jgi:hypothetical protein
MKSPCDIEFRKNSFDRSNKKEKTRQETCIFERKNIQKGV